MNKNYTGKPRNTRKTKDFNHVKGNCQLKIYKAKSQKYEDLIYNESTVVIINVEIFQ